MKQMFTLIVVAITLTLAMVANANEVAINTDIQTGKQCLELNMSKNLTNQLGLFAYAAQTTGWSEAYVGPTYAPTANLQVGIAAGIESGQTNTRFGGFLWAGHKQFSLLALGEDGGSGQWWKLEGKYAMDSETTVGILQEINKGTGLLVERKLDKEITIRVRLYGEGRGDVGLKLAF